MTETIKVGIADLKVKMGDYILITTSLGSCIAIVIYDPIKKIGGLAHVMHADSSLIRHTDNPAKCVDSAIDMMLNKILDQNGGLKRRLKAYIVGGACMFPTLENSPQSNIGKRNIQKAVEVLEANKIKIYGQSTGGNYGRSVEFNIDNGEVKVVSKKHGDELL